MRRSGAVIPAPASPSPDAFAASDAGFDYFTSEAHYQSLAGRIFAVFRAGHSFALVVKDGASAADLVAALDRIAAPRYVVVDIACRPGLGSDDVLRAVPPHAALPSRGETPAADPAEAVPLRRPAPLFVLDEIERLSYEQLEQIYDALQPDDHVTPAVVLLAQVDFLARLERPALRFLKDALAETFVFRQLAREEVGIFILHQLRAAGGMAAFPAETVAAIADVAMGDPTVVNRLARLVLDFAATSGAGAAPVPAMPLASVPPTGLPPTGLPPTGALPPEASPMPHEAPPPGDAPARPSPPPWLRRARPAAAGAPTDEAPAREENPALLVEPAATAASLPPRRSKLRVPVGILVALAYVGIVGTASIAVFSLLHPAAKNFVGAGIHDITVALNLVREKVSPPPTVSPAEPAVAGQAVAAEPAAPAAAVAAAAVPAGPAASSGPAPPPTNPQPVETADLPPPSSPAAPAASTADAEAASDRAASAAKDGDSAPLPATAPAASADSDSDSAAADVVPAPADTADVAVTATTESAAAKADATPAPASAPEAAVAAVAPSAAVQTPPAASSSATAQVSPPAASSSATAQVSPPAVPSSAAPDVAVPDVAALSPAAVAPPSPAASEPESPATPGAPHLSAKEIASLLKRGNDLVALGDIVSARLYYERAAEAGDAHAALLAGETFDPNYLNRIGVLGVPGDPAQAAVWYQRAQELGEGSAAARLESLKAQ